MLLSDEDNEVEASVPELKRSLEREMWSLEDPNAMSDSQFVTTEKDVERSGDDGSPRKRTEKDTNVAARYVVIGSDYFI